jgi:glucosyl-dolichyl phosphate glucuronosyltransferase
MISLSVIIPTRNRANFLEGVLLSITKQTYKGELFEVIVADNGSTDKTKEICESYIDRIKNLHYYYDAIPGLHVGRHLGLKVAASEILVYADDDIEAFPTWLEGIAESFKEKDVVLVGGKNLPKFEVNPPDWIIEMWKKNKKGERTLGYLSILDLGDEIKDISPFNVFGCNFSIRKNILLEAGGFHPDAMPQELIRFRGDGESHVSRFISKKGYRTIYQPKASVYHSIPSDRLTEEYFCRRAYNQGVSDSYAQLRNKYLENNKAYSTGCFNNQCQYLKKTAMSFFGGALSNIRRYVFFTNNIHYKEIRDKIRSAYYKGWAHHLWHAMHDSSLLQYILRDNYL